MSAASSIPSPGPGDTSVLERPFDDLLAEAVRFHGHLCPGQVLGVRMVVAGCRALGLSNPRAAGKRLVVFVEIDRCATDAIEVLCGVSLGKGTLRHVDHGKMAATFVDTAGGGAVRVAVRDDARERAPALAPAAADPRQAQTAAYRVMPDALLLRVQPVVVHAERLERHRARIACEACGEGVTYRREVRQQGRMLCRACAGEGYWRPAGDAL